MGLSIAGIDYELLKQKVLEALQGHGAAKDTTLALLLQALGFLPRRTPSDIRWVYGSLVTAPAAGTALVSFSVPTGKTAFIYGYFISASEANAYEIRWVSGGVAQSIRITFPAAGTAHGMFLIPVNEGLQADAGSTISIVNINAGAVGSTYQAGLLIVVV